MPPLTNLEKQQRQIERERKRGLKRRLVTIPIERDQELIEIVAEWKRIKQEEAMTTYEVVRYAADGCAGEQVPYGDSDGEVIWSGDLEECRDAISKRIGGLEGRRWDGGDDDVEAYHENEEEGCGGYAIRVAD